MCARYLTSLVAVHESSQLKTLDTAHTQMEETPDIPTVTLQNVHTLTTYQLRQELTRRNEFHLTENDPINYRILLKLMVDVLTKDAQQAEIVHAQSVANAQNAERERCVCVFMQMLFSMQ